MHETGDPAAHVARPYFFFTRRHALHAEYSLPPCIHPAQRRRGSVPGPDGVVHHEAVLWHPRIGIYMSPHGTVGRTLFEWVPILEEELTPYPSVALVLSSTWCIRPGYAHTLKRLPESLRSRFIGGTYHKRIHGADPWNLASFRSTPCGMQILADVQRRKPRHWVALDDDIEDWPQSAIGNLIACEGTTGLSNPEVRHELRRKLQQSAAA